MAAVGTYEATSYTARVFFTSRLPSIEFELGTKMKVNDFPYCPGHAAGVEPRERIRFIDVVVDGRVFAFIFYDELSTLNDCHYVAFVVF